MDDKISKLEEALASSTTELERSRLSYEEVARRLSDLETDLRSLPAEEKKTLQVNDTDLPELLEEVTRAKLAYESWRTRTETNAKYLAKMVEAAATQQVRDRD
mmetsp:Transcript_32161/g.49742  ORF Transcript_32161/g.49742 Transcript_32161/m.49742 type:complete len:103 (-) Transcript_32161:19-327(-)